MTKPVYDPVDLLSRLIAVKSVSREETHAADLLELEMMRLGLRYDRYGCNLWSVHPDYDPSRPTLLLNSHIDTVRPVSTWTRDPFRPEIAGGRLYGLGANDAGASAVSLLGAFSRFYSIDFPINLILALTAEEEVMGEGGMRAFLPHIEKEGFRIDMAIVGEPTSMHPAVAERGLLVLDCVSHGISGHAARNEGVNAIYKAMADIDRLRNFQFDRESDILGPVRISITMIESGSQHNVVPDTCRWVADVRTTDAYSNEQTVELLRAAVESDITPRSTRVWASVIREDHPLVRAAVDMGGVPYVSPTTSDMALMHGIPSLKIGPGESSRSHTADEFVMIDEIRAGMDGYMKLLNNLSKYYTE